MPETCPPRRRCNAGAPGWLNGNHPTVAEGEVKRMVCYQKTGSCCYLNNLIKVLNCGPYFVYELRPVYGRYCGADARKYCLISWQCILFVTSEIELPKETTKKAGVRVCGVFVEFQVACFKIYRISWFNHSFTITSHFGVIYILIYITSRK